MKGTHEMRAPALMIVYIVTEMYRIDMFASATSATVAIPIGIVVLQSM